MSQLVEKYQPATIDAFAGLDRARAILSNFARNPYPSAWLLVGDSGLGKTTMALALAQQIGGDVHHIPSRKCDLEAVETIIGKCYYHPWKGQWNFVLVDEADQMSRAAQHAFLSKLDTTAAPPATIFLFTANDTQALEDRFISRCRRVTFSRKGILEPAAALLERIWNAETKGKRQAPDFAAMVAAANCNIREALNILEMEILAPGSFEPPQPPPPVAAALSVITRPAGWDNLSPGIKAAWTRKHRTARAA